MWQTKKTIVYEVVGNRKMQHSVEEGFVIQKFDMSFQLSGLTPKTPILGHLAAHSKSK
jgi:hypothetical protein